MKIDFKKLGFLVISIMSTQLITTSTALAQARTYSEIAAQAENYSRNIVRMARGESANPNLFTDVMSSELGTGEMVVEAQLRGNETLKELIISKKTGEAFDRIAFEIVRTWEETQYMILVLSGIADKVSELVPSEKAQSIVTALRKQSTALAEAYNSIPSFAEIAEFEFNYASEGSAGQNSSYSKTSLKKSRQALESTTYRYGEVKTPEFDASKLCVAPFSN